MTRWGSINSPAPPPLAPAFAGMTIYVWALVWNGSQSLPTPPMTAPPDAAFDRDLYEGGAGWPNVDGPAAPPL